jgi:hypothetical protein
MTSGGWLVGTLIAAVLIVIESFRARRAASERRGLGL